MDVVRRTSTGRCSCCCFLCWRCSVTYSYVWVCTVNAAYRPSLTTSSCHWPSLTSSSRWSLGSVVSGQCGHCGEWSVWSVWSVVSVLSMVSVVITVSVVNGQWSAVSDRSVTGHRWHHGRSSCDASRSLRRSKSLPSTIELA